MKKLTLCAALIATALSAAVSAQPTPQLPRNAQIPTQPLKLPQGGLPLVRPDLTVMSIQPRMLGGAPYVYVCVKNQGPGNAGAFDVQLAMGAPAPTGSPPISWIRLVGVIRYPAISSGGYACNDFLVEGTTLPNCVKYSATADIRHEVAETNETNNQREHLGTCLGEPPHMASVPKFDPSKLPVIKPDLPPIPGPGPGPRP
jgi:CARDB